MNIERYRLRRRILEFLCDTRPALVERLKKTRQISPGGTSPYHLEDSVWTHTLLAFQNAINDVRFDLSDILCTLVHDFGKPDTAILRQRSDGSPKISFLCHGPRATQMASDFLLDYQSKFKSITCEEIAQIAFCVSGHLDFYNIQDLASALKFCGNDYVLLKRMEALFFCDVGGSIMETSTESFKNNARLLSDIQEFLSSPPPPPSDSRKTQPKRVFHFICGAPTTNESLKLPFDCPTLQIGKIREEVYAQNAPKNYRNAPLWQRTMFEETASKDLTPQIISGIEKMPEREIAVSGILSSRKARKFLAHNIKSRFPDSEITCTYLISHSQNLPRFWRQSGDERRKKSVLEDMLWLQPLPNRLHESCFSKVEVLVLPKR